MSDVKQIKQCLCCKNIDLRTILDLGLQPLANSYCKSLEEKEQKFPLKLNLCLNCFHLQLSHKVDPNLMFKNYLYVSGTTNTLKEYFKYFANFSKNLHGNVKNVLDIACNDGSQLDAFKELGIDTYGVDPAENLFPLSSKNHNIICDFFNKSSALKLKKKFSLITAQNVFAHTSEVDQFLKNCKILMDKQTLLMIQTSQCEMVKNNQFDTIYHEHISFFNVNSMKTLLKRNNLFLVDVIKTPIHGTSYVFIISKDKNKQNNNLKIFNEELNEGLYNPKTYYEYSLSCQNITFNLKNKIDNFKKNDYIVVGYGAAAKGNTLLNFGNIDLDFVVDDNKLKQDLYTPGRKIKIVSIEKLSEISKGKKLLVVPLAWNFYDEIKQRIIKQNIHNKTNSLSMIRYFPELKEEQI